MVNEDFGLNRGRRVLVFALALLLGAAGKTVWDAASVSAPEPAASPLGVEAPPTPAPRPMKRGNPKRTSARRAVPAPAPGPVAEPAPEAVAQPVAAPLPLPPLVSTEPEPQPEPQSEPEPVPVPAALVLDDGNGEAIARAIANAKRGAVQHCFERELKASPRLNGTVVVELDLAPPQQVNAVHVSDDLERPRFTQCVSAAMKALSFSGLNEEISVRVPYVLSARGK